MLNISQILIRGHIKNDFFDFICNFKEKLKTSADKIYISETLDAKTKKSSLF